MKLIKALERQRLERRNYTPYGHLASRPAQTLAFCAERLDGIAGAYLLGNGHRAYSPQLMRFHSADRLSPFGAGGLNAYAYCLGDPVNHIDPTGGEAEDYLLPALSILTNALGLFVSGLRFRSFYKRSIAAARRSQVAYPNPLVQPPERSDWVLSSVSAASAVAGLTVGVMRTVDPDNDWQTWALTALTSISLVTTGVEAWRMALSKPWQAEMIQLNTVGRFSASRATSPAPEASTGNAPPRVSVSEAGSTLRRK
ncbi:RHS repeat-associated core domain-containing protein [Pseudomonas cremoricolorata]|uniref:RHS repeat-associated core domain-containing protein n=1 Tax=Pseudomonas cremoricolorata TaxID=157783 RepID=UPI0009DBE1CE